MKRILLVLSLSFLAAAPAFAAHRYQSDIMLRNPDARTSVTVVAGVGRAEGDFSDDADLFAIRAALVHPATDEVSLLLSWDRTDADWGRSTWGGYWVQPPNFDATSDLFSFGIRVFLK